ncbi:Microtubule-associated proteins 1A/1B light chain 3C [Orchesella cincta]|uniref:Microtubule-associated proteins 1A/1B light chain 3C n=1 Tax=Orchesella cincta TaxID=48709 RepID=A0A1D2NIL6_ORCCI|nr:Microtubule-associated proteins 1A/1B light chain 3C [Orchesella cincta]
MPTIPDNNDNTTISTKQHHNLSFKQRKPLAIRKEEVAAIRVKFPAKVPVIVERYHKETQLPSLDKTKFLVPEEITMSQFITIVRNRLQLNSQQALYLLVSNKNLASLSRPLSQIYRDYRDDDGFLYVTYASQEVFG